jgi:LytS/YehU family sensor histidine kinase
VAKVLLISVVVYSLIAIWYVAPWLKKLDKRQALTAPLWVHVFRYLCLYLPIAQREGYAISDRILNVVVIGDLSGAVLALTGIIFLRMRSRLGPILAALVLIASIVDIAVGTYVRSQIGSDPEASGVWWLVFVFFAPLVLVSLPLLGWQLYQRRGETLSPRIAETGQ